MTRKFASSLIALKFGVGISLCAGFSGCQGKKNDDTRELASSLIRIEATVNSLKEDVTALRREIVAKQTEHAVTKNNESASGKGSSEEPIIQANYKVTADGLDDPFYGRPDSRILIMVFIDYQCAPCRVFFEDTFEKLRRDFADTGVAKLVLRDFPLEHNKFAHQAAEFAHCAGEQSHYWDASTVLRTRTTELDGGEFKTIMPLIPGIDTERIESCFAKKRYEKEVDSDIAEGIALGARGAPGTFIGKLDRSESNGQKDASYSGVFIRGAQPFALLAHEIKKLDGN